MPDVKPVVVYSIMGVTILVFLLQLATESMMGFDVPAAVGMKVNELIIRGQVWRLFTPMLLHASVLHIGFNMYALYALGPLLERNYGHGRFLLLYLLSGFAGNVLSFLFSPAFSLGSSTAVFGVLAAEGMFLYQNRQVFGSAAQRALGNIITVALINLVIGLSPGIDNWGHLGGLIGGVLFAWLSGPILRLEGISPNLQAVDTRDASDVVRGVLVVALVFGLLAAGTIYMRM